MRKILFCALILSLFGSLSFATMSRKLSVRSLSDQSDRIVVGQISRLQTFVDRGNVWSLASVTVEQKVKGAPSAVIHFRSPGGTYLSNGRTIVTAYEGVPHLKVLDRAVFFLEGRSPEYLNLTGLQQGLWKIRIQNGEEMVVSNEATAESDAIPLTKFVQTIHQILREKQK